MAEIVIKDDLAKRLQEIAQQENRSVEDMLQEWLEIYRHALTPDRSVPAADALDAMQGMFADEVTDISSTVRETMTAYYRQKYDRPG